MFERFTESARQVVTLARREAFSLHHSHIGTEHILLGLLSEGKSPEARAITAAGLSIGKARAQVTRIVGVGPEPSPEEIPFTPRSKKVLELAFREALARDRSYIGTEHILLGLLTEGNGLAVTILHNASIDVDRLCDEFVRLGLIESSS